MKAVILAGGLGTRLSEETSVKPKPMIEMVMDKLNNGPRKCLGFKTSN
jgi:dTDP-glucose pyrophosphorylase